MAKAHATIRRKMPSTLEKRPPGRPTLKPGKPLSVLFGVRLDRDTVRLLRTKRQGDEKLGATVRRLLQQSLHA